MIDFSDLGATPVNAPPAQARGGIDFSDLGAVRVQPQQGASEIVGNEMQGIRPQGSNPVTQAVSAAGQTLGFPTSLHPAQVAKDLLMAPAKVSQSFGEAAGGVAQAGSQYLQDKGVIGPYAGEEVSAIGGVALDPRTYLVPGSDARMMRPNIPIERQPIVSAMENVGMNPTYAQKTGSRFSMGLENTLEKAPMGNGPINERYQANETALLGEKHRLQSEMGTPQDVYGVGHEAKSKVPIRSEAMRLKREDMFQAIPDNVSIPLSEYSQHGAKIISEESKIRPLARNKEVMTFAEDAQHPYISTGEGVTGGPEYQGITKQIPGQTIPPSSVTRKSSLLGESGMPLSYKESVPGKNIPPSTEYGIQASASPETSFSPKSNYFDVKGLRETLTGKITEAHNAGNYKAERQFIGLKKALDADIENFANSEVSPLDSMVSKEFKESYGKANAFSRAYKGLFKSDEANALLSADPNKIVDLVFKGKNAETQIKKYRAITGEEGFTPLKQKFTQDLLESPNINRELKGYEEGTLMAIYSEPELNQIRQYGLAQEGGKSVSNLQGTQGSARSNIFSKSSAGLGAGIYALATGHPILGALGISQFIAPRYAAKALLGASNGIPVGGVAQLGLGALNAGQEYAFRKKQLTGKR